MKNQKPLYDHDAEVYDMINSIVSVIDELGTKRNVEYGNNIATISFSRDDGLSLFEIDILDGLDEVDDDWMQHQFDSSIRVEIYRNEQVVGWFNGAFKFLVLATIREIINA